MGVSRDIDVLIPLQSLCWQRVDFVHVADSRGAGVALLVGQLLARSYRLALQYFLPKLKAVAALAELALQLLAGVVCVALMAVIAAVSFTWRSSLTERLRVPSLCGSRPYFPAAP